MTTQLDARWTRTVFIVGLTAVAISAPAWGADRTWIGSGGKRQGGDGSTFISPFNWSPAVVPGALDRAIFGDVGGEISFPSGLISNDRLLISGQGLVLAFDLNGGIYKLNSPSGLGAARSLLVATASGDSAELLVVGGTVMAKHAALATAVDSEAAVTVEPSGALHATSALTIGEEGSAWVTALGELLTGDVVLAQAPGSTGSLHLDQATGILIAFGDLTGGAGSAELRVTAGGLAAVLGNVELGQTRFSSVDAEVSGLGSALLADGDILLGGIEDHGGIGTFVVDDGGLVRGQGLGVGSSMAVDVLGGRLDCVSLSAVAAPIAIEAGALVVGAADAEVGEGFFAGLDAEAASVSLSSGATLAAPFISLGQAAGSTTEVLVDGPGTAIGSAGDIELGWAPVDGAAGAAALEIRSGGQLTAEGALRLRQGAIVTLETGSAQVGGLDMSGDEGVIVGRFLPDASVPFVDAADVSQLGGGLFIEQLDEAHAPLLGEVLPALRASFLDGRLAAVIAKPLPGLKYYKALPYGGGAAGKSSDQVAFEITKLDLDIGLLPIFPVDLPGTPNAVVAGPYDSDEFPDLCVTIPGGDGSPGLCVLLVNNTVTDEGDGDGVAGGSIFSIVDSIEIGADPSGLAAADLNGDGRSDFVISDAASGIIQIVYNTLPVVGGGLQSGPTIAVGGRPRAVMAKDLDGTGRTDLVWTDDEVNQVFTAPGDDKGGFGAPVGYASGPQPSSVCPLDLDNDKDLDLAVVNQGAAFGPGPGGSSVGVYINQSAQGGEGFAAAIFYPVGEGATAITEGDLDQDGIMDLVTADSAAGTLSILVGLGNASFRPAISVPAGGSPLAIAAGDIDNDLGDDVDIAVIVEGPGGVPGLTVYRNDSANGQLVLTILEDAETVLGLPKALTTADTDQDGPEDLVLVGDGEAGSGGFASVVQAVPVFCPSDFDGNGVVDGGDIGILLADYGPNPDSPADLNDDGFVNEVDLILLLKGFGSCTLED